MSDYAPRPARWAQPELVAEIEFSEWTRDGRVRHAGCLGLRYNKARGDVIRQEPAA